MRKCPPFLIPLSEIDEIVEGSCVRDYGGAEDGPLVVAVRGRNFLECPVQVRREERSYARDCRQLVVIEEDDTSRSDKMPEVEQVDEDILEAMVAVDEREGEASSFAEEARQRDMRLLHMVFHHFCDSCLVEEL